MRALALLVLLAAAPAQAACLLPAQKAMVEAELMFGREIPGGGAVSDADWTKFVDEVLAEAFPGGFTVSDAEGAWRDAKTGAAVREKSKLVFVDGKGDAALAGRLERVADVYKRRFRQDAVGIVTREICAAF
ncbi:MAG TPA: DUF3574 domain-containing protein [Rhizomicrobium sp.]|nr:DUF3574 domain-containing protein [Rhizomicrobium sp.]